MILQITSEPLAVIPLAPHTPTFRSSRVSLRFVFENNLNQERNSNFRKEEITYLRSPIEEEGVPLRPTVVPKFS